MEEDEENVKETDVHEVIFIIYAFFCIYLIVISLNSFAKACFHNVFIIHGFCIIPILFIRFLP